MMNHDAEQPTEPADSPKPTSRVRRWVLGAVIFSVLAGAVAWGAHAFGRVRNRSIECILLGEARQISSAANQYFTETEKDSCTLADLVGQGKHLSWISPGIRLHAGIAPSNLEVTDLATALDLSKIRLSKFPQNPHGVITIGHEAYSTSRSRLVELESKWGYRDSNCLVFDVESGQLLTRDGKSPARP